MAKKEEDITLSLKELKRMKKERKKELKREKKRKKMEKKLAKKQAKMRKKGVFLEDVAPPEEAQEEEVEVVEEIPAKPWVKKSSESMPFIEKKIDKMAERRKESSLQDLFAQRYGESLITPETYKEYELSDEEKTRLEVIASHEEEVEAEGEIGEGVPLETNAAEAGETIGDAEVADETTGKEAPKGELKPIWYPFQLWLYSKYGKERMILLKILILLVSVFLFIVFLIPRIIVWIIMSIKKKMKQRKAAKAPSET